MRGGREELRAALLRPCLLRLARQEGAAVVQQVLEKAQISRSEIDQDSTWISLAAARRVLEDVADRIGDDALSSRGEFATRPEIVGIYVSMLRRVRTPLEAYQYLPIACSESWRVGSYSVTDEQAHSVQVRYRPPPDGEVDQSHRCFCLLRQAELKAIPALWGLGEAQVRELSCMAQGDPDCTYSIHWKPPEGAHAPQVGAFLGAALGATAFAWLKPEAAALTLAGGSSLGFGVGLALGRRKRDQAGRHFERSRIAALEHGLEQHGRLAERHGDLTHSVLGGKYRILRTVGSGGIGTVYAAEHLGLGVQVAVKVLRGAAAVDGAEVARLRREGRVQMSIEHPNVVRTFDLDQLPDGTLYVVMELLQGISLHERLKRERPLQPSDALPIFLQACRALSAAHRLGIVHRDLKPANIFLCSGGVVKVLDFGMSKLAEEETLTQEGYTLGTPEYMSPEQCVGGEVDPRSDIYAFGVLMYEALTGELPFRGRTRQALLEHHQRSTPRPLLTTRPDLAIPPELDRVVMACLKKRPSDRPASAQLLEHLLASVPPQSPTIAVETPEEPPRSSRLTDDDDTPRPGRVE